MLTDEELEYAAQVAEQFPPGHGGAWFWRAPPGFFLDPEDDVKEAETVLRYHATWDVYGDPAVRLACARCRARGWEVTADELFEAWQALEAAVDHQYNRLIHEDPVELARQLRASRGAQRADRPGASAEAAKEEAP